MNVSEHFRVEEFIPKELYYAKTASGVTLGDLSARYINPKLIIVAEIVREHYKVPVTINDWHKGGDHDGRCVRLPSDSAYKLTSGHDYNLCLDFSVDGIPSEQVQKDVLNNEDLNNALVEAGVQGMEDGTDGWTHLSIEDLSAWGFPEKNGIKMIPVPK